MWKYWIDKSTSKTFTEQKQQSLNGRDKRCTVLSRVLPNLRTFQVVETILRRHCLARCLLTWIKHWLVPTFFLTGTVGAGVNGCTSWERLRRFNALLSLSFSLIQAEVTVYPLFTKSGFPQVIWERCGPSAVLFTTNNTKQQNLSLAYWHQYPLSRSRPSPISSHVNQTNLVNKGFIKWPKRGLSLAEPQRELNLEWAR